ncbi:MAG: SGNH/GDSL hydrolase family protein [Rhodoglobus sp.]
MQPLLQAAMLEYKRDVAQAVFPTDDPDFLIEGPDELRVLFIGDVAAMGYGVLRQGMTVCARVAESLSRELQRGVRWEKMAAPDLTIDRAAKRLSATPVDVDLLVILAGVPDVLLMATPDAWAASLEQLMLDLRLQHPHARVIVTGLPPVQDFKPIPPRLHRMLADRVDILDAASWRVARSDPRLQYVAFPATAPGELKVLDQLSWATLHGTWARAIVPAAVLALEDSVDRPDTWRALH